MKTSQQAYLEPRRSGAGLCAAHNTQGRVENELTLNTDVNVILRLLGLSCVFIGFGEGVYTQGVLAVPLEGVLR